MPRPHFQGSLSLSLSLTENDETHVLLYIWHGKYVVNLARFHSKDFGSDGPNIKTAPLQTKSVQ